MSLTQNTDPAPIPAKVRRKMIEENPIIEQAPGGGVVEHFPDNPSRQPGELITMGIDPGVTGAWFCTAINPQTMQWRALGMGDMPVIEFERNGRKRRKVDGQTLAKQIKPFVKLSDVVCTELVFAPPGIASAVAFSLGMTAAATDTALSLAGVGTKLVEVMPRSWKNHLKLSADKEASIRIAENLFGPGVSERCWYRKKDHNRAEAALIAVWAAMSCENTIEKHLPKKR